MEGPIKPVHELYQEIENIQNELQDWKKAYEDLELEKERIYEEMVLCWTPPAAGDSIQDKSQIWC